MKRYWTKIGLGALGIFVLGMVLVSWGRHGVDHIKEAVKRQSVRLSPDVASFAVNNIRLGSLTGIEFDPEKESGFPYIDLTVQLDSAADLSSLENCLLVASDAESLQGQKGLTCSPSTSSTGMVEMGTVNFEPAGQSFPIFAPASAVSGKNWFVPPAHGAHQAPSGVSANNSSVNFQANAAGAFMLIKDEKGRPVFQLNADSQGAFIQIRDSNGKEVMRIRADSQGLEGQANSD